jgi:molecular chaperone GrpE
MAEKPGTGAAEPSPASADQSDISTDESMISTDPVADLQRERDEYHDRWLRKSAEFDNYRKRVERERRELADQSVVNLLQELLLVVDDFDRASTVDAGEAGEKAAYRKGVELIHAKLHDLLRKMGVHPIDALGADFDPNLHQAVMQESSPDHREGSVTGELRKGYMLHDRLLRPAMVKVAKA